MTISRDERDRLRKLEHDATEGPWVASADYDLSGHQVSDESILIGTPRGLPDDVGSTAQGADAEFIAAVRTAVPALLDALDNAEQRLQAVRDVLNEYDDPEVWAVFIRRALDGDA